MHAVISTFRPRWYAQKPDEKEQRRLVLVLGLLCVLVMSLALFVVAFHWIFSPGSPHIYTNSLANMAVGQAGPTDCGSSVKEALEKGCLFDPVSFSWLAPDCYDSELVESFLELGSWAWHSSKADSSIEANKVHFETVALGEHHHLWVTREFHLYHCTFQWRKMHRAILRGKPLDGYIGNYSHTEHCEGVLTNAVLDLGLGVVDVQIQRKFATCGVADYRSLYQGIG